MGIDVGGPSPYNAGFSRIKEPGVWWSVTLDRGGNQRTREKALMAKKRGGGQIRWPSLASPNRGISMLTVFFLLHGDGSVSR